MIPAVRSVCLLFTLLFSLATASFAMSGDGCGGDCASCHSLTRSEAQGILKDVGSVKAVAPSAVRGLFEVTLEKDGRTGMVYLDYGKKHLVAGQVFDLATKKVVGPATPEVAHPDRLDPKTLSSDDALVMGNPAGKKRLFVFTDPDCPYCAKLHGELRKLVALEPDLSVFIKLYPLKMHPHAYDKARVIMSKKSLELLERSYAGGVLPAPVESEGRRIVDATLKYAEKVGISATPTLVLADGRIVVGAKSAQEMQQLLAGK